MTAQPDIILLVLDTQRVDRLSCYGYGHETSRYLDNFAADATRFRQAYATAQWTVPSHASMFTGLYPADHSMLHAFSVLPDTIPTLAERLSASGYFTAAFCNNPLLGVVNTGLQRGFHSFLNYGGLLTSRPHQSASTQRTLDRYRHYFKRNLASAVTALQDVFARSDTLLDLSFSPLLVPLWQTALSFKGNTAKALKDTARLHIERAGISERQPVFSFVNLMGTHMPYHPREAFTQRLAPDIAHNKSSRRYLRQFNSDVFGWMAPLTSDIEPASKMILDGMYDAEVANQDDLVGAFLDQLRSSGRLDNTLLIVCADHGEHLGEKQLMGHSISLYNTLVHVPLIIRDPSGNFPRATTVDTLTSTRRIFHTILTTAQAATPEEEQQTIAQSATSDPDAGRIFALGVTPQNLLNIIQRHRPELIAERHCDQVRRAVWHDRYKLIQTGDDELELYDIFNDPDEQTNLAAILPEQAETLQSFLHDFSDQDRQYAYTNAAHEATASYDDPQVYRRLHDLGYLE